MRPGDIAVSVEPAASASEDKTARQYQNYRALVARAVDVFGDEIKATRWLSRPESSLNKQTPLQYARSRDYDPESLEPLLARIEHGVDF
jgi:uncharacterized protein (DUF2384 family)